MNTPAPLTPYYWLEYGQHGLSSMVMWKCFMGRPAGNSHPWDAADFGRCYKLLEMVPVFKAEMNKLKSLSSQWCRLVENWDKLSEMYEQKDWRLSDVIYDLVKTS